MLSFAGDVKRLLYHTQLASTLCGLSHAPPAGTRLPAAPRCPGAPGARSMLIPLHSPRHLAYESVGQQPTCKTALCKAVWPSASCSAASAPRSSLVDSTMSAQQDRLNTRKHQVKTRAHSRRVTPVWPMYAARCRLVAPLAVVARLGSAPGTRNCCFQAASWQHDTHREAQTTRAAALDTPRSHHCVASHCTQGQQQPERHALRLTGQAESRTSIKQQLHCRAVTRTRSIV